jgi:CRISPR/Cas system CSM-associated protein Csm3 (group 7 of RAMP superfamily)
MKTLSPLFIPNAAKDNTFNKLYSHSYDFSSYEDLNGVDDCLNHFARPIIPGSSIRGVLRSAFEAVTNSCMSSCDDENTLYRRTPVPRKFFGVIEKDADTGERVLYRASKWKLPVEERSSHKTGEELDGGVYLRGEDFPGKKNDAIMKYELDASGNRVEITRFSEDSREWSNFVEVWRLYQPRGGGIKGVNQNKEHSGYPEYLNAARIPVYYTKLDNGSFYYLAPAAITKEVFSRTLKELLEHQGGHNPCADGKNLCPACRLFGLAGEDSIASRLMFRDATPVETEENGDWRGWYDAVRVLPILSGPKVSATEFYMEDVDGAAYFNYDYFVNYNKDTEPVRTFLDNPRLRGRKFYRHRKSVVRDETEDSREQRTQIRPVGTNKTFKFEIVFDRITETELETLLWVLTFGENNSTHAHKLGHAKPYGYGSVRVTKAEVSLITLSDGLSLSKTVTAEYQAKKPADSDYMREYLALTDYSKASDEVNYPMGEKNKTKTTYNWFGINKEIRLIGRSSAFNPAFNYVLPKAAADDPYLPGYAEGNGDIGGNRAEIMPAAAPEAQPQMPMPGKATPVPPAMTVEEFEELARKYGAGQTARAVKKTVYNRDEIKRALTNFNTNLKSRELLDGFLKEYEADPEHYKDLKGTYESIKRRYTR